MYKVDIWTAVTMPGKPTATLRTAGLEEGARRLFREEIPGRFINSIMWSAKLEVTALKEERDQDINGSF